MRIVTDFDGTLTNIRREFDYQYKVLEQHILDICDGDVELKEKIMKSSHEYVQDRYENYGWSNQGRVAAFGDEDLFTRLLAQMQCLDQWIEENHPAVSPIRAKVLADPQNPVRFQELSGKAYDVMNQAPLSDVSGTEPEAVNAINLLLSQDVEVVVVSNSPAYRIIEKLEDTGLKPVDHDDNPSAQFRVRGLANKFGLGEESQYEVYGKRMIDINRPNYRRIIAEERPTAVIGDVFSLDLALPLYMAKTEKSLYDSMQVYLRMREYTPQWAIDAVLQAGDEYATKPRLLNHYSDLPNLLHKR